MLWKYSLIKEKNDTYVIRHLSNCLFYYIYNKVFPVLYYRALRAPCSELERILSYSKCDNWTSLAQWQKYNFPPNQIISWGIHIIPKFVMELIAFKQANVKYSKNDFDYNFWGFF